MFTVADAMGHTGRRMLSTVTRTPNDARQGVVEALQDRQAGQARRIANALSEGFAAPDTAAQRVTALTAARDTAADANYGAARASATPVDVSAALRRIDNTLSPGVTRIANPQSGIADDSVEGALRRARSMLTDGRSNLTDFNAVHRAQQDIGDMIGSATRAGRDNQARLLTQVRNDLDRALSGASAPYAAARDQFRQGSQAIEAVEQGRLAARRGRSQDTIPAFNALAPEQQAGFRAGYADPLIEQAEGAAFGTNKARPLINDATGEEFPAFAAPGQADRLGRRIGRENAMFETRNQALGNSGTAQNLADMADAGQHTSEILMSGVRDGPMAMVMTALTRALNEGRGLPPSVLARAGSALMETRPDVARQLLSASTARNISDARKRAMVTAILDSVGGSGAGRLPAP